jgi:hypothetical protein
MPSLSWNEIKTQAIQFSRRWASETREQAEKQTFWNEFFLVFGIPRRTVASFEEPVERIKHTYGFIDLLWKGKLLVEHKSAGASLEAAEAQAFDYIQDLQSSGRGDDVPRYILLSDFRRFALYDLEPDDQLDLPLFRGLRFHRTEFPLSELHRNIRDFAFIPGYKVHSSKPQDPLNLKAVAIMGALHDTLKAGGYTGHDLERFLVRILFCLFAEDTGIFEPESFKLYVENRTHPDGNDLGARLAELFETLDCPIEDRQQNLDDTLKSFPYVNGELFRERLRFAAFNGPMRKAMIEAAAFDWSRISPAIFGALFQEVMEDPDRRKIGAHYTSERDILKVIQPLFLDALRAEFESIRSDASTRRRARLDDFRLRLTQLRFLDPACGCGNFLVIAYRELRALELDVLREQHGEQQQLSFDEVNRLSQVDVHQFYGIEIGEWPVRIAEVALWLMDHQSNLRILEAFSQPFVRLPLRNSPHIHHGNALRMDWNDLLPGAECSYVLGNPPFVGAMWMSVKQHDDVKITAPQVRNVGILDYVCGWYFKAADYIQGTSIGVGFVSTNSLSQGEQVAILWMNLFDQYNLSINFAYTTFPWESEARGKAHVHVIIVGFATAPAQEKLIFDRSADDKITTRQVTNISPYLVEGPNLCIPNRSSPLCAVPPIRFGSMPRDGGHLLISEEQYRELQVNEPTACEFIRPYTGADDFLNGGRRFCLWLGNSTPAQIESMPTVKERLKQVRQYRMESKAASTRKAADTPGFFVQLAQPTKGYLLIPRVSSERRRYVPMAFRSATVIANDQVLTIEGAESYQFGVLTSTMHMAWVRRITGRLKSDLRYSKDIVYNNYPWPQNPTPAHKAKVEELAQAVLDARALYPDSTLAQLYDPLTMPSELVHAHQRLDRAVERCYRPEPFASDRERVEFLFALYEKLTAPLLPAAPRVRRRRRTD